MDFQTNNMQQTIMQWATTAVISTKFTPVMAATDMYGP